MPTGMYKKPTIKKCGFCNRDFTTNHIQTHFCNECKIKEFPCACGQCQKIIPFRKYIYGARFVKGHGRKGGKNSIEHNLAISRNNTGRHPSEETLEKMSVCQKGKKLSQETKDKISKIAKEKGFGKWMTGTHPSEATRKKYHDQRLGHFTSEETKLKISAKNSGSNNGMYGEHHTEECKLRIGKGSKDNWQKTEYRDKILKHPGRLQQCRKGAIAGNSNSPCKRFHNTIPERKLKEILDQLQINYIHGFPVWNIEHGYVADFFIEKYNLILEVDGKYWHNYPNGNEMDKIRSNELQSKDYNVIRVWEDEFDINSIRQKLNELAIEKGIL